MIKSFPKALYFISGPITCAEEGDGDIYCCWQGWFVTHSFMQLCSGPPHQESQLSGYSVEKRAHSPFPEIPLSLADLIHGPVEQQDEENYSDYLYQNMSTSYEDFILGFKSA